MADLDFKLHPAQLEIMQCPARFVVCAAGRRFGKSYLATVRAIIKALDPRNARGLPVWIVGPTQQQTREIYWDLLLRLTDPIRVAHHINDGYVTLEGGLKVHLKGSDRPDTLRGPGLYDVTIDEFADIKPNTWTEIIRPMLADVKGTALIIGTPKLRNHFYKILQEALFDTTGEWAAFQYRTIDNPFIDPAEVEAARRDMSESEFRQEFLASFETGGSDLFKLEQIKYREEPPTKTDKGDWVVAIDLAGFEEVKVANTSRLRKLDQTVIMPVFIYDDGRRWVRAPAMGRWGVKETAERIVQVINEVKPARYGIEKGALFNAVMPYVDEECGRRKMMPLSNNCAELSHENRSKVSRVTWALQGRLERGEYEFQPGPWTRELEDQVTHFPSKWIHDDIPDAIAYAEQLAEGMACAAFDDFDFSKPYWTPNNRRVGY